LLDYDKFLMGIIIYKMGKSLTRKCPEVILKFSKII
jgi:hypothetical protein